MKIVLPSYITNYELSPIQKEKDANLYGLTFKTSYSCDYEISWGNKNLSSNTPIKYGVMETGFFHNASFIDTVGNYQSLSLNTYQGYKAVAEFDLNGRKSAKDIIFNLPENKQSKYNAAYNETDISSWNGPILILQNPKDRSILSVTTTENYLKFIKDCCEFYGEKLFVKFHPWNSNDIYTQLENIIKPYGCKYGKARMSIIENAEFCISFNSTFAVDALLRGVPYVQYAMGTFFNAYGVIYSEGKFPTEVKQIENSDKLCDFLIHKFCFNHKMDRHKFANMIKHYANSKEMFPMIDEFSYANNI